MGVREDFEREVEIVRGAGGFAPTTADLRAFGERLANEALCESWLPERDPVYSAKVLVENEELNIAWHWSDRDIPEIRELLRAAVPRLRLARVELRRVKNDTREG